MRRCLRALLLVSHSLAATGALLQHSALPAESFPRGPGASVGEATVLTQRHGGVNGEASGASNRQHISPSLRPRSDSQFFKRDYPRDSVPHAQNLTFSFPYPVVQDGGDYDKDYIKDENGDDGEWKAQTDYDRLRIQVQKQKEEVQVALERQKQARQDLANVQAEEAQAERKAKKAEEKESAARQRYEDAADEVDRLTGKSGERKVGGEIGEAIGEVNHEISDVDECQKQLRDAREKLKQLMEEREARRKAMLRAQRVAAEDKDAAEAEYEAAKEAQYDKMDEDLARKVREHKRDHAEAMEAFRMSEEEIKRTEDEIRKAAERLRQVRRQVDPDGGVYRSDALAPSPWLSVSAGLAFCAAVAV